MNSYDSVTDSSQEQQEQQRWRSRPAFFLTVFAVAAVLLFGISASAAQVGRDNIDVLAASAVIPDAVVQEVEVAPTAEELEAEALRTEIGDQDQQIEILEQQVEIVQGALSSVQAEADETQSRLINSIDLADPNADTEAIAMAQWEMGYSIGGGSQISAFRSTILPCESGNEPDPDTAVGRTDDWGRAQINRPTWKNRFESLTGASFEENITNPVLNGFMAAHVEQEQGLSAWTCWRNR